MSSSHPDPPEQPSDQHPPHGDAPAPGGEPPQWGSPQPGQYPPQGGQPGAYPPQGGQPGAYPPQWGQYPPQWGQYPAPAYYTPAPQPPTHPSAQTAMILGLVGLIGSVFCYVPVVLGPFAWFKGLQARREIDAQPGRWSGRDQAQVGYITGVIATVLLVLGVLAVVVFVALAIIGATIGESSTVA